MTTINTNTMAPSTTMDADEAKKLWVDSLINGKYIQGRYNLRSVPISGEPQHCVLGVLNDLYHKHVGGLKDGLKEHEIRTLLGYEEEEDDRLVYPAGVSPKILKWLDFDLGDTSDDVRFLSYLSEENDEGAPFIDLADLIIEYCDMDDGHGVTPRHPKQAQQLWLDALTSGEYQQGHGVRSLGDEVMHYIDTRDGQQVHKFSVLGVLVDQYQKHGGGLRETIRNDVFSYAALDSIPPDRVLNWVGMGEECGPFIVSLMRDNDNGVSFCHLAKRIEAYCAQMNAASHSQDPCLMSVSCQTQLLT